MIAFEFCKPLEYMILINLYKKRALRGNKEISCWLTRKDDFQSSVNWLTKDVSWIEGENNSYQLTKEGVIEVRKIIETYQKRTFNWIFAFLTLFLALGTLPSVYEFFCK